MTKTMNHLLRSISFLGLAVVSASALRAQISVTLTPSVASPKPVGTVVTWTAKVTDGVGGTHEYQWSVGPQGGPAAIVRDFSQSTSFPWAFSQTEGTYEVTVVVRNTANNIPAQATHSFVITSLYQNGKDHVTTTANPLVALFSGPPCAVGNSVRVRFNQTGSSVSQTTNAIPCSPTNSANFYIAGMYPSTEYQMHHETVNPSGGIVKTGKTFTFTTGPLPAGVTFPTQTVLTPPSPPGSTTAPILLQGFLGGGALVTATDLEGNILWYYHLPVGELARTEVGGKMLVTYSKSTNLYNNTLEEIDLAGNITLQTNAQRINEQLALMTGPNSQPRRPITQFDHEARRLSSGNLVVKASSEMLVTNAAECGTSGGNPKTCDVIGTQVLVLNPNLQVIWAWDAFDFLDINRRAILGEVCKHTDSGCPVFFLGTTAQDWVHGNSVQLVSDGSLLVSMRHQDWVIDINYANGTGDGSVIWKLGNEGDFTMNNPVTPPSSPTCTIPTTSPAWYAWFTHQHDANFQFGGTSVFETLDNATVWYNWCDPNTHSRGYVLTVDIPSKTVTPLLIQDLGSYSNGLGTAQVVPGTSNYHFLSGQIAKATQSTNQEFTPAGLLDFAIQENHATYRAYRMQDLYTPEQL
jgi:arylsulfate sulfotransferase